MLKPFGQTSCCRFSSIYQAILSLFGINITDSQGRLAVVGGGNGLNAVHGGSKPIESLEARTLLAYTVAIVGSSLVIEGTDARECLYLTQRRDHVEVREFCRDAKSTSQEILGVFAALDVRTHGDDDKVVLKGFSAESVDVLLGSGDDTIRYYDVIADEFCVDMGAGNDVAKARRNAGDLYMLEGDSGTDQLIDWNNNRWVERDITSVEKTKVVK